MVVKKKEDSSAKNGSHHSCYDLLKSCEVPEYVREISIDTGYRRHLSYPNCILR